MKKLFAVLCLAACNTPEPVQTGTALKVQAQQAVNDVVQALRAGDLHALQSRYVLNQGDFEGITQLMLETQAAGLKSQYGDSTPTVTDVLDEGGGNYSVGLSDPTELPGKANPKRLHLWRDPGSGALLWSGVQSHKIDPPTPPHAVQQAHVDDVERENYDCWNQASVGHDWMTMYETSSGQSLSCFTGTDNCAQVDWVTYQPLGGELSAGWSGYVNVNASISGTQYAVARVDPTNSACHCSNHTGTAPSGCCWVNSWGWDMWWPGSDTNQADNFTCGAPGSCP